MNTSLLLGSLVERERTKFPFQRLQLKSYSNSINRRRHMIPVLGESQGREGRRKDAGRTLKSEL